MKNIFLIHFQPLEYYPPVTNFIDYLSTVDEKIKFTLISTHNDKGRNVYCNKSQDIRRFPFPGANDNILIKIYKHFLFNFLTLLTMIVQKPQSILYYESYSAYPVYLYKKFFNCKVRVLIHFHEYFSKQWYADGMKLVKYYHQKEKNFLFNQACWISQTNAERKRLFLLDNPNVLPKRLYILPNYPPRKWSSSPVRQRNSPLRLIYVGSVSLHSCYLKEICEYVDSLGGKLKFDIYSYNIEQDTKTYLIELNSIHIRFFNKGVEYEEIPQLLKHYDVGVILYKALTLNYRYNAPNKLFEYLSCGLDVWFPKEMFGIHKYERADKSPKILKIDFENLNSFAYSEVDRNNTKPEPASYHYENVFPQLVQALIQ